MKGVRCALHNFKRVVDADFLKSCRKLDGLLHNESG